MCSFSSLWGRNHREMKMVIIKQHLCLRSQQSQNTNWWHCSSALSNYSQLSLAWLAISFSLSLFSLHQKREEKLLSTKWLMRLAHFISKRPFCTAPTGVLSLFVQRSFICPLPFSSQSGFTCPNVQGEKKDPQPLTQTATAEIWRLEYSKCFSSASRF